jgi:hypothetical protein
MSKEDKEFCANTIRKIEKNHFGHAFDGTLEESQASLFCSFMTEMSYVEYECIEESKIPRIYEKVPTFKALNKRCREFLKEYNQKSTFCGRNCI